MCVCVRKNGRRECVKWKRLKTIETISTLLCKLGLKSKEEHRKSIREKKKREEAVFSLEYSVPYVFVVVVVVLLVVPFSPTDANQPELARAVDTVSASCRIATHTHTRARHYPATVSPPSSFSLQEITKDIILNRIKTTSWNLTIQL